MNFWFFPFLLFLVLGRAAQVAPCLTAALAKGAVRAGILLRYLLVHTYILQPLTLFFPRMFCIQEKRGRSLRKYDPASLPSILRLR
jgi:hypothetical protein